MKRKAFLMHGACALVAGAVALTGQAWAQSATLEEVVVTARKREESLQQVPVAVSSATAEQLDRQGIRQATDLGRTVPSLQITAATSTGAAGAVVSLRGQSMGDVLLTLSPAVGLYIDSANVPHPSGANVSFYDLQRIEVLKGAQGTLYGRNTTGGAINVITRGPDYNGMHGYVEGEVGNYSDFKVTLGGNLPIIADKLALRLAYQHWDRDGYGHSVVTGQKLGGDRQDDAVRASLRFDPTDNFQALFKFEYAKADRAGLLYTIREFTRSIPAIANTALNEERFYTGVAGGANQPWNLTTCVNDNLFDSCSGTISRDDVKTKHGVIDLNWDITDSVHLRSVTGYHWFETFRVFDLDATPYQVAENGVVPDVGAARPNPAPLPSGAIPAGPPYLRPFALEPDQASNQWTQEFNLSGNFEDRLNWLVGAFYSIDRGEGAQLSVRQPATLVSATPNNTPGAIAFRAPTIQAFEGFHLNVTSAALFTQNDIKLSDRVSVTLGARYTEERMKQLNGAWIFNQNFQFAGTPLAGAGQNFQCLTGPFVGTAANPDYQTSAEACGITQGAKFSGTSYLASLNIQFTPDILAYFRTARGFQGGALQWRAPQFPAVRPQTAEDYEIGFKGDFLSKRLRANLAVFQTNYSDQQLSTIVFLPGTNVRTTVLQNAADARIRGVEVELRGAVTQDLNLYANFGYLDATYLSFANALVTSGAVRDRSGEPFDVPKWTGNVGGRYEHDIGPGRAGLQVDVAYRGERPLTATNLLNPLGGFLNPAIPDQAATIETLKEFRKAYTLVNARLDYTVPDWGLQVTLWATNLFDKKYQLPSIDYSANFGLLTGITQEPRMYGLTVRKSFGDE